MTETTDASPGTGLLRRVLGSIWLRVVVTTGLLAVVAANVEWSRMESRVTNGRPGYFVLAVALVTTTLVVGVLRWRLLLLAARIDLGVSTLARIYAISTFSGTFLPTSVGGDIARTLLVVRRGPMLTTVAVSVAVDRIGGLVGVIGVAWIALAFEPGAATGNVGPALIFFTAAMAAGGLLVLALLFRGRAVARFIPERVRAIVAVSGGLLRAYAADLRLAGAVLVTSLAFQGLIALSIVSLARSIDVELTYPTAALALALMTATSLIPISVAGFGIREASYIVILGSAGISASDATLISLLTVAALFFASLPGAFFLMHSGTTPALEAS